MKLKTALESERLQLQQRLENDKENIRKDVQSLQTAFKPLELITNIIGGATDTVTNHPMAMFAAKFGANALPGKLGKSKLISVMAQIFVPIFVSRVVPMLSEKAKRNHKVRRITNVLTTLRDVWYRIDRLF